LAVTENSKHTQTQTHTVRAAKGERKRERHKKSLFSSLSYPEWVENRRQRSAPGRWLLSYGWPVTCNPKSRSRSVNTDNDQILVTVKTTQYNQTRSHQHLNHCTVNIKQQRKKTATVTSLTSSQKWQRKYSGF